MSLPVIISPDTDLAITPHGRRVRLQDSESDEMSQRPYHLTTGGKYSAISSS